MRTEDGKKAESSMKTEGRMHITAPCIKTGNQAALIACSNGLLRERRPQLEALAKQLWEWGLTPVLSRCLYAQPGTVFSGTPDMRAKELTGYFADPRVSMIFDVSGGDAANGILPYLDYERIKESRALFFGYSDLTTVANAIFAKTGRPSVLYQARNLAEPDGTWQQEAVKRWMTDGDDSLFSFSCRFLRGQRMEGVVIGGNIRCFLKLAGTEYWPDMKGKLLLLEASGGQAPQMACYLAQLQQLGVFEKINGILLGTFLQMEEQETGPGIGELVLEYTKNTCPVAQTSQIGHRSDSHAAIIGKPLFLVSE